MRIGIVLQFVVSRLQSFPKAVRGNVAMIFGIALVPLCIAVGVGLDMSRAMITHARIANALDAAGLAVGSQPGMSQDDMQKLAREYFKQNYTADEEAYGTPQEVALSRPAGSQTITLSTQVQMPTVLMRVVGIDTMDVSAQSQITWGQTKLWVALVLDNTGSMCQYPDAPNISTCPTPDSKSKIVALKAATHSLLQMLQNAASNDGDVKVSIIPFSKDVNVGTGQVASTWIDWTNWEAPPPNWTPDATVGPGSTCPWTTGDEGYKCMIGPANGSSTVTTVPSIPVTWDGGTSYSSGNQVTYNSTIYIAIKSSSNKNPGSNASYWTAQPADYSGYLCPSMDNGSDNSGDGSTKLDAASHYYNGCYDSTVASDTTETKTGSNQTICNDRSRCTTANYCTTTVSTSGNVTTTTEQTSCTCGKVGRDSNPSCSATPKVTTETKLYNHAWHANAHSTWTGCIMDRAQDYDTENTAPAGTAKFPAENSDYCLDGNVTPLAHDWGVLSNQVDAMKANGNTNQTVGLAWGWQTLTNSDPYNPGELPEDTRRVLILLTDGLNTQNRWTGNAGDIDDRTEAICKGINDDKITVYTVLVMAGSSSMLKGCASSDDKYFELTTADQIVSTFQTIGTQITNLRVSL